MPLDNYYTTLPPQLKKDFSINYQSFIPSFDNHPLSFKLVVKVYQIQSGWVEKHLPPTHSIYKSLLWRNKYYLALYEGLIPPMNRRCEETGMTASGISEMGHTKYDIDIILPRSLVCVVQSVLTLKSLV